MTNTTTPTDTRTGEAPSRDRQRPVDVLFVDRDQAYVDLAVELLERRHEAVQATGTTDTDAALDRAATGPVDCLVCGHQPPRLDGIALVRRVSRRRPDLPMLVFTPDISTPLVDEALDAGATDVVRRDTGGSALTLLANRAVRAVEAERTRTRADRVDRLLDLTVRDLSLLDCWHRLGAVAFDADLRVLEHAGDAPTARRVEPGTSLAECFPPDTWDRLAPNCRAALDGDRRRLTMTDSPTAVRAFTRPRSATTPEGVLLLRELAEP